MAPPPRKKKETAPQAFQNLRQAFDVIKEKHTDAWNWHEYLTDDPEPDSDEEEDTEGNMLKPEYRPNIERLKAHLLTLVAELNRTAAVVDTCYFHMCTEPDAMKECCIILGTSGDIDEEMLSSGNASPQKLMAALQGKLDTANEQITLQKAEIEELKDKLCEARFTADARWQMWQKMKMLQEETLTRLHHTKVELDDTVAAQDQLKADYRDLYLRYLRASRLMLYKGRQMLRDQVFKQNKRENLFYAFQGFMYILKEEREERIRREREAERDSIEFALRNEVSYLLNEKERHKFAVDRLAEETGHLKKDRRALACRLLHKNRRPFETLEYCLWVWELWQPLRKQLRLEKLLETEKAQRAATNQQLVQTSAMVPYLAQTIDDLRLEIAKEQIAHDTSRRELTLRAAEQVAYNTERLRAHRNLEQAVLHRIHRLDVEGKEERIAVLEREIAEDKHIHALKGMVVDLETSLRRALDRRKVRGLVVEPGQGTKCAQCQRNTLFGGWRGMSPPPGSPGMQESASARDLGEKSASLSALTPIKDLSLFTGGPGGKPWPSPPEKEATYTALWR